MHGQRAAAAEALLIRGAIQAAGDRPDLERASAGSRDALWLANELEMRPLIARCHLGLGRLYGRTGERDQSRENLTTATEMFREMDMRFWLEQAEAESRALAPGSHRILTSRT